MIVKSPLSAPLEIFQFLQDCLTRFCSLIFSLRGRGAFKRVKLGGAIYLDIIERPSICKSSEKMALSLGFFVFFKKNVALRKIPLYLAPAK